MEPTDFWRGYPRYQCPHEGCPFDTLEPAKLADHLAEKHPKPRPPRASAPSGFETTVIGAEPSVAETAVLVSPPPEPAPAVERGARRRAVEAVASEEE